MAPYKTESPLKVRVRGLMDAPRKRLKRRMQQHGPRKSFLSAIPHLAHDRTRLRQRNQVDIAKVPHSPGTNPRVMHNYAGSDIVNDIDHVINDFTPFLKAVENDIIPRLTLANGVRESMSDWALRCKRTQNARAFKNWATDYIQNHGFPNETIEDWIRWGYIEDIQLW